MTILDNFPCLWYTIIDILYSLLCRCHLLSIPYFLLHLVLSYPLFSALNFYVKVVFSVCQYSVPISFVPCYLCILWISPTVHAFILMSLAFLRSINHFMKWIYVWNDFIDFLLWVTFPVNFGKLVCMHDHAEAHIFSLLPVHAYLSFLASLL